MTLVPRMIPASLPRLIVVFVVFTSILSVAAVPSGAAPSAPMACDPDGVQASGAVYRICMPASPWNGELFVYAHGYVPASAPIAIPEDQLRLPDGTYIPDVVTNYGYAFATTSYSVNGLAVKQGLADLVDLVGVFRASHPTLHRVFIIGASEGGLITTLAVERYSDVFSGGLASCGPIGSFQGQINYADDFRVVFDYFFPELIPGSPVAIPPPLIANWDAYFATTVVPALTAPENQAKVQQLLNVSGMPYIPGDADSIGAGIQTLLWYNVNATNDVIQKLGGQPFDNQARVYSGSLDDAALNAGVQRFSANPVALAEIQAHYETAGWPQVPLVTAHTTNDQWIRYWHQLLYRAKVVANKRTPRHDMIEVDRFGHCNFTSSEMQSALFLLLNRVNNPPKWPTYLPLIVR